MNLKPNISLSFNGQCEAAFKCYEQCFGGTISYMLRWGDSPEAAQAPSDWGAKIYHATLKVGDTVFNGGDRPPGQYERPSGFSLILQMDDEMAAERLFEALAENATIQTPLQQTFWAKRFAALIDQYGIPWSINCE
jgi:PhnB protein